MITLVYVRRCVRSFAFFCSCVAARSVVSSFVCFHFVSAFACGTFRYRSIVPSWSFSVRSDCVVRRFLDTRRFRDVLLVIGFVLSLRWYFALLYRADGRIVFHVCHFAWESHVAVVRSSRLLVFRSSFVATFSTSRVLFPFKLDSRRVSSLWLRRISFVLRSWKWRETSSSGMLRRGFHVCSS